jgi:hypothetical protein
MSGREAEHRPVGKQNYSRVDDKVFKFIHQNMRYATYPALSLF